MENCERLDNCLLSAGGAAGGCWIRCRLTALEVQETLRGLLFRIPAEISRGAAAEQGHGTIT